MTRLAAALAALLPAAALAEGIEIALPHIVAPPAAATVAGGYMQVTNAGEAPDRLVDAAVDPLIAGMAQLHEMQLDGDVMRMSRVAGVELPPGATVAFERGGLHVMLMDLAAPLEPGDSVPVILHFERAGEIEAAFAVVARGEEPKPHGPHGHD